MKPERADRIKGQAVEWLWDERIPVGDVTLIAGRDGAGKSTFGCWLAAEYTQGRLTGGEPHVGKPGNAYLVMAEDHYSKVIKPRLEVAGGDLSRIHIDTAPKFTFPGATDLLAHYVVESESTLVIIDPVDSFIRSTARGRAGIDELKAFAQEANVSVVMFHHFNRAVNPDDLNGSIGGGRGLMAAVRSRFAWGLVKVHDADMPDDPVLNGLIHLKNSYAEEQDPMLFARLKEPNPYDHHRTMPRLEDRGEYPLTGHHMFPKGGEGAKVTKAQVARDFILNLLEDRDEISAQELLDEAKKAGISQRTLEGARSKLADEGWIRSEKRADGWWWSFAQLRKTATPQPGVSASDATAATAA